MTDSLAAFRNSRSKDLRQLAEEHIQHDLTQSDRDLLHSAGSKVSTHASFASLAGLGLGVYFAYRLRTRRIAYFNAFRAIEKPVEVRFADGRTEPLPDLKPHIAPTHASDILTFSLFSLAGLFLGGELGLISGTASAARTVTSDPEAKTRIEKAFRSYRLDVLRREIKELEDREGSAFGEFWSGS